MKDFQKSEGYYQEQEQEQNIKENKKQPIIYSEFNSWKGQPMMSIFDFCEYLEPRYNEKLVVELLMKHRKI